MPTRAIARASAGSSTWSGWESKETTMTRDTIFATPQAQAKDFAFDGKTAEVFDDMLQRSVPMYDEIQRMVVALAGALAGRNARLIGIDSSQAMLDRASEKAGEAVLPAPIEWLQLHIDEQ